MDPYIKLTLFGLFAVGIFAVVNWWICRQIVARHKREYDWQMSRVIEHDLETAIRRGGE